MKKGFTLIELLGVIIILAMLMLLVFPNIMNILDSGRETIDTAMQTLIETATYNYMEDNRNSFNYDTGDEYCITLQTLVNSNLLKEPITYSNNEKMDLNMFVKVNVTNNEKLSYEVTDTCNGLVISNNMTTMENFRSNIAGLEEQITSIVFEDTKNMSAYNNATHKWDLSEIPGNEMVIGYLENGILYVQANGKVIAPVSMAGYNVSDDISASTFGQLQNLTSINFEGINTKNVESMVATFYGLNKIEILDLSSFNTTKVKTMTNIFMNMTSLKDINLRSFNLENTKNLQGMFANNTSLQTIDLSSFDTTNVTNMSYMFFNTGFTSLDIKHFDTTNVTTMRYMFLNTENLTDLDISNFNTFNVTDMELMLSQMHSLENLNVSNFDTSNVTNMNQMFRGTMTNVIDISSFDIHSSTNIELIFTEVNPSMTVYVKNQNIVDMIKNSKYFTLGVNVIVKP